VRAAITGVIREGTIAAVLTGLMILLFLGNWKSTLIVAISIPLSVLVSIAVLSALGETVNIMTLGGLALAVGILVDDATVEIENINRNLAQGKETVPAILDGAQQIAVPAFVSTLCICIVFVPMFFLTGVAKYLFVPLAEAVVFAMLASYVLSRTLVPTMAMYLLKGHHGEEHATGNDPLSRVQRGFAQGFERMRKGHRQALGYCLEHAWMFIVLFLVFCAASGSLVLVLGRDFFPSVDGGVIRLHMRARPGQRVRQLIPAQELSGVLDNIGLPNSTINTVYSNSGVIGTQDAEILIGLKPDRKMSTRYYTDALRGRLNQDFPGTQFFFQPADIVSQILNFGAPDPIDIQLVGTTANQGADYALAQQISNRVSQIPGAVDVHVQQQFSTPTMFLDVDRTRAEQVGLTQNDVAQSLLLTLSSSAQISPSFWVNPKNGVEYTVAVQVPQYKIDDLQAVGNIPISAKNGQEVLGNLATVSAGVEPALISHYNAQPMINVYAAVEGRDLGGVAGDVQKIMDEFRPKLSRGTQLELRGQVRTMQSSFVGLGAGVAFAIILVYLLIVVNFQSWLDPFIIITALPGALAGIIWMLLVTHTTLSVPSLTGTIMCMGVATSNSILMVSFARERMAEGLNSRQAALEAGFVRIRPVIMTALAMIIGMVPMALSLGEAGEQNAPLGRTVIGGLVMATFATLFFVPCVFSLVHRGHRPGTPMSAAGAADI
jgi:multidrug efflux pump subunit AcrB